MTIVEAVYNRTLDSVDVSFSNYSMLRILRKPAEENLNATVCALNCLKNLAEHAPMFYAKLFLREEFQNYVNRLDRRYARLADFLYRYYKANHPELSEIQIESMIRIFQLRDS